MYFFPSLAKIGTAVFTKKTLLISEKIDGSMTETVYIMDLGHVNDAWLKSDHPFKFYSVSGAVAVWNFPDFEQENSCQEHITFLPSPNLFWPLRHEHHNFSLRLQVRSFHSAFIFLLPNPYYAFPRVTLKIGVLTNQIVVTCDKSQNVSTVLTKKAFSIGYWVWTELNIEIITNQILLTNVVDGRRFPFVNVTHDLAKSLRWFSIGSNSSVTHWTFFCQPIGVPPARKPDCVTSSGEIYYTGDQWVTSLGN